MPYIVGMSEEANPQSPTSLTSLRLIQAVCGVRVCTVMGCQKAN